jgi:hypothetical protein
MSTTDNAGTCIAVGIPQPEQFHQDAKPLCAGGSLSPVFTDRASPGMLSFPGEQFRSIGIEVSPEEAHELEVFDDFLARHVQPDGAWDVQCMLLWNEWVRNFRRRVSGFPILIREKEFRSVIADRFGVGIASDGFRGAVYPGIRFVP